MKNPLILLALSCMLLSSCVSTLHKYFFAMGREGECVQIAEPPLYRAGDGKVYMKGYRTTFSPWPDDYMADLFHRPRYKNHIEPTEMTSPVWGEMKKTRRGWERADSPWLTCLPNPTKHPDQRLNKLGLSCMQAAHNELNETVYTEVTTPLHSTAHALYAYPLGVLTLFTIDTPATVIGCTAAVLASAVVAPCFQIYDQIKHSKNETDNN